MKNRIVILAAGKGTRMQSDLPKVLHNFGGRPMICRLLNSIKESGVDECPLLVVSPENINIIKAALSEFDCDYVIQEKQLGTGHALSYALPEISESTRLIVLYGDHPFISSSTIAGIAALVDNEVAMLTVKITDFSDWREIFYHWGRVIRDAKKITEIIEFKDADDKSKEVLEVNPAIFSFNSDWVKANIGRLKNLNVQKEYYLTDMIKMAVEDGISIGSFEIPAAEAIGINSLAESDLAAKLHL
ncbi:MAG: NTP transferase domain-containing protein [Candidatus Falkowbacteria bacterium]